MSIISMPGLETIWKRELRNRDQHDCHVYIIAQLNSAYEIVGPVKVGVSSNPVSRLQSLQTGSPSRLVIVARYTFWKRSHALAVEKCFHDTCAVYRLEGEWFDIEPAGAVSLMEGNIYSFAKNVLQPDDSGDWYFALNHLGVSQYCYDLSEPDFRYGS